MKIVDLSFALIESNVDFWKMNLNYYNLLAIIFKYPSLENWNVSKDLNLIQNWVKIKHKRHVLKAHFFFSLL